MSIVLVYYEASIFCERMVVGYNNLFIKLFIVRVKLNSCLTLCCLSGVICIFRGDISARAICHNVGIF